MQQNKPDAIVDLMLNVNVPHRCIVALQNLFAMVYMLDEKQFLSWYIRAFSKIYDGNATKEQLTNLRKLGKCAYKDIAKIAAPLLTNAQVLPLYNIVINFKHDDDISNENDPASWLDGIELDEFNLGDNGCDTQN